MNWGGDPEGLGSEWDPGEADEGWGAAEEDQDPFDAYGLEAPEVAGDALRRELRRLPELTAAVDTVWPLLDPHRLLRHLWASPDLLRRSAPWLNEDQVRVLRRDAEADWTVEDLPLLDAAVALVGDPAASSAGAAGEDAERERSGMDQLVDDLIASDDSEMGVMSMLRGQDLRATLSQEADPGEGIGDRLSTAFAHIIVDEAQELTDAEWQMLLRRNPSGSFTVVGDRAQARRGFRESWQQRLHRVGLTRVRIERLNVNYRTPQEIMQRAVPVILRALPDANIPTSVRSSGRPVLTVGRSAAEAHLRSWLNANEGTVAVIGDRTLGAPVDSERVRHLEAGTAKGLEFDLVMIPADAEEAAENITAAVDRYVAMTRSTRDLVVVE